MPRAVPPRALRRSSGSRTCRHPGQAVDSSAIRSGFRGRGVEILQPRFSMRCRVRYRSVGRSLSGEYLGWSPHQRFFFQAAAFDESSRCPPLSQRAEAVMWWRGAHSECQYGDPGALRDPRTVRSCGIEGLPRTVAPRRHEKRWKIVGALPRPWLRRIGMLAECGTWRHGL